MRISPTNAGLPEPSTMRPFFSNVLGSARAASTTPVLNSERVPASETAANPVFTKCRRVC
jgi:hypothetical protein